MFTIDKINRFFLYCAAYYVLEPRFKSGAWTIRKESLVGLRRQTGILHQLACRAEGFFSSIGQCAICEGYCCHGAFNRFTVYDHIAHIVEGYEQAPQWGYSLRPIGSYAANRVDDGKCSGFIDGKGCKYERIFRPAICTWGVCEKMESSLAKEQKVFLRDLRRAIERAHLVFAWALLSGGMRKV